MPRAVVFAIDLIAISLLTFAVYFPRYRRKEMVVAYLGLNIGVLTVAVALSINTTIGTGFGLGLFGALSIIRLRSSEVAHSEVAYYFAALALGLLGGIQVTPRWAEVALPAAILVVMFIGDHPKIFGRYRHQLITLDRAIADEDKLRRDVSELLNADVVFMEVRRLDIVNDSTTVDVRYRVPKP